MTYNNRLVIVCRDALIQRQGSLSPESLGPFFILRSVSQLARLVIRVSPGHRLRQGAFSALVVVEVLPEAEVRASNLVDHGRAEVGDLGALHGQVCAVVLDLALVRHPRRFDLTF